MSEESIPAVQLSLRIRHPVIDPQEISTAIGVKPEHCFKAGAPRTDPARGGRRGLHTQTYWLAPITPESWPEPIIDTSFLSVIAARYPGEPAQDLRAGSIETILFYGLHRLTNRHAFLERIQSEGGDVSLVLGLEQGSASDFTLPVAILRLLGKLGITLEFKFDS
jgi:hypothetical protein